MLEIDMRPIILFQLLLLTTSLHAVDVYKYTDPEGKIYFTNKSLQDPDLKLNWKRDETNLHKHDIDRLFNNVTLDHNTTHHKIAKLEVRPLNYDRLIQFIAAEEKLHPHLLHAVVRAESGYRPQAVSRAGALGLMQLMPSTAKRFQVSNLFDPMENLRGGARYLRHLLDVFDNDLRLTLAAYNSGEYTPSIRTGQIPSNAETRRFVKQVQAYILDEQFRYPRSRTYPSLADSPTSLALKSHLEPVTFLETSTLKPH